MAENGIVQPEEGERMENTEQVILMNKKKGFGIDAIVTLRGFAKVTRVDGLVADGEGRFEKVVIHFAQKGLADKFLQAALTHFGNEIELV